MIINDVHLLVDREGSEKVRQAREKNLIIERLTWDQDSPTAPNVTFGKTSTNMHCDPHDR